MHGEDSLKQASRGGAEVMQSQKKAFINEKQRKASVRFSKDHVNWTVENWGTIIFSDESKGWQKVTNSNVKDRGEHVKLLEVRVLPPNIDF